MMNPFTTLQLMVRKQNSIKDSFKELREFVGNLAYAVRASGLAPDTASQLDSFEKEGLRLLLEMFLTESRHYIKEQSAVVDMDDIIQTAKAKKEDD